MAASCNIPLGSLRKKSAAQIRIRMFMFGRLSAGQFGQGRILQINTSRSL
jgi:hypothetical protein